MRNETHDSRLKLVEWELSQVERECDRLVSAIAAGGELDGLLGVLKERETRRASLESERRAIASQQRVPSADAGRVCAELCEPAGE